MANYWIDKAVNGLRRSAPELSAATPMPASQRLLLIAAGAIAIAVFLASPETLGAVALAMMAMLFAGATALRLAVLAHFICRRRAVRAVARHVPPDQLPSYTVIAALYNEPDAAPVLIAAMSALVYPRDKLQIVFATEADDIATRVALVAAGLQPGMEIISVPDGLLRTKPRALNYSLAFSSGSIIAVYDAEDQPEPDQLLRAAAAFHYGDPSVACVQAALNVYNRRANAITRQFALEYTALFDAMLPALEAFRLPIPLGGTSNHFRRRELERVGGWDPFNVTEDADLGIRLARAGLRATIISSTTWEEAPSQARVWRNQRTRWLKGWMQTYLVHMRHPWRLARDLGPYRFFGFQLWAGTMVLSPLVHPWCYIFLVTNVVTGGIGQLPDSAVMTALWAACWISLGASILTAMATSALAVRRRQFRKLARSAVWIPVYWLGISFASYRALFGLIRAPYRWEKTPHGRRRLRERRRRRAAL